MTPLAGVDGCPGGWVAAIDRGGEPEVVVVPRLAELLARETFAIIAVDIPIGLMDAGPRRADTEGRAVLGPRRSSMMPAPIRAAAYARSRAEADAITRAADGRGVAAQAFGIYAKVTEADDLMRSSEAARRIVVETHPEVGFRLWMGEPLPFAKKTPEGAAIRGGLVEAEFGLVPAHGYPRKIVAPDDVLDAFACLWSARRIVAGTARIFGGEADAEGLPMRIVA